MSCGSDSQLRPRKGLPKNAVPAETCRAQWGQYLRTLAPSVRFPVTICVLCYGPNANLAGRFLESLYTQTEASLFTLRAGLNEVEKATHRLFKEYSNRFGNIALFVEPKNKFKNPLMRRMFREKPLTSTWTIWCDDDTHFTRGDWLQRLALKIEHSPQIDMWGWIHTLCRGGDELADWIRCASWYRGIKLVKKNDPEGNRVNAFRFIPGAFWALRTEVIYKLDWPDPRLVQAAEDFLLGEALRQNEFKMEDFRYGIKMNDAPRRNADALQVNELRS